ncbi:MAG TPA: PASTA domain-containing protein [Coriobacteriia bacterium]|nr:PASTA domain-containing protein [Coriobacteriia bacterium]
MMPKFTPSKFAAALVACALATLLLVPATAHAAGVVDFDAGDDFSVAVLSDGTLWGWGYNAWGQLGDATHSNKHLAPVRSTTATQWADVAAGSLHTLALKNNGELWAWGWNKDGELGIGHAENTDTPAHFHDSPERVGTASNWIAIDAGLDHSIALDSSFRIWAWGGNGVGQLGDGTTAPTATPKLISTEPADGLTWKRVWADDDVTFALASDGSLWQWGAGGGSSPGLVGFPLGWQPAADSSWRTLAPQAERVAAILGTQLWDWTPASTSVVPQDFSLPVLDVAQVSAPAYDLEAALVIRNDSGLYCAVDQYSFPQRLVNKYGDPLHHWRGLGNSLDWTGVAGGRNHFLMSKADGSVWAWGINAFGQLGDGSEVTRKSSSQEPVRTILPTPVPYLVGLTESDATEKIEEMGFAVGTIKLETSDSVPITLVMQQTPVQDALILPGEKVNLVVSAGLPIPVPNVVGKTEADARSIIGAAQLGVSTVTTAYSALVPEGSVISQNPAPGTPVIIASKVSLVVSKGPQPTTVPFTTSQSLAAAKAALEGRGFVVGDIFYEYSTVVTKDRVIRTDPLAGTGSFQGQRVNLFVSMGKPKASVTTPIARAKMRKGKYYTVYGYLKPLHAAGSTYVRVYKWHKTKAGTWVPYGYVNAKLTPLKASSKYSVKIRLKTAGRWRIKAYAPEDSAHAAAWSTGYDYITVK